MMSKFVFMLLLASTVCLVEVKSGKLSTFACIAGQRLKHLFSGWDTCAERKMNENYNKMTDANCLDCDKYFHCQGNYEAAQCDNDYSKDTARMISDCRDDPDCTDSDCKEDRKANEFGRDGGDCASKYLCADDYHCAYNPNDGSCKTSNCP